MEWLDLSPPSYLIITEAHHKSVIILSLNLPKDTAGQRKLGKRKRIIKRFSQAAVRYTMENLNLEEIIICFRNGFAKPFSRGKTYPVALQQRDFCVKDIFLIYHKILDEMRVRGKQSEHGVRT